jgi:hypothetical protein
MQWPKDTKGVIRSCKSRKGRQCNGQKKREKKANKTKDGATQIPLKTVGELG